MFQEKLAKGKLDLIEALSNLDVENSNLKNYYGNVSKLP
jgi:hypothetical protein